MSNVFLFVALILSLVSCSGSTGAVTVESEAISGTSTLTPSPTVEWFPPTETPAPQPTPGTTSTPSLLDGVNGVVYSEIFRSLQGWMVPTTNRGEVNVDRSQINIVIREPGTYLAAVRENPEFDTYYVEITASPSLCQGKDEYGLLFQASGQNQYYRYGLSCDGELRLDRVSAGTVSAVQPWTPSSAVPRAAPSQSRLGVLVERERMSFFIDDALQFSVEERQFTSGTLGVFAHSRGETAVTVSFSGLIVRELEIP